MSACGIGSLCDSADCVNCSGGRPTQHALLVKLRLRAENGDAYWYAPQSPSERTALSFLAKRGKVEQQRFGNRLAYRLPVPPDSPQLALLTEATDV